MKAPIESSQFNMNVPSVTPESLQSAGIVEQALGQTLSNVAETAQKLNTHIMDEEATASVYEAKENAKAYAKKRQQDLLTAFPDGYMKDSKGAEITVSDGMGGYRPKRIEEEYFENLNTYQKDAYKSMPNGYAQDLYKQNVTPALNAYSQDMDATAPGLRLKAAANKITNTVTRVTTDITANGSTPLEVTRQMRDSEAVVDSMTIRSPGDMKTFDPVQAQVLKNTSMESIAEAFPESIITRYLEGKVIDKKQNKALLMMGINELQEAPGTVSAYEKSKGRQTIASAIPTEKREAYIQKMLSLFKEVKKQESDDLFLRADLMKSHIKDNPKNDAKNNSDARLLFSDLMAYATENPNHNTKVANTIAEILVAKNTAKAMLGIRSGMDEAQGVAIIKKAREVSKKELQPFLDRLNIPKSERNIIGASAMLGSLGVTAGVEGTVKAAITQSVSELRTNFTGTLTKWGESPALSRSANINKGDRNAWTDPKKLAVIRESFNYLRAQQKAHPEANDAGYLDTSSPTQLQAYIKLLQNEDGSATNEAAHAEWLLKHKQGIQPEDFRALMEQAVKGGGNDKLLLLPAFNDPAVFKAVATSLFKKEYDKDFERSFESSVAKEETVKAHDKLREVFAPYSGMLTTDYGGSGASVKLSNSLADLVMIQAKADFARDRGMPGVSNDFSLYIEKAKENVLSNFAVIDLKQDRFNLPLFGGVGNAAAGQYVGPAKVNNVSVKDPVFTAHLLSYMRPLFNKDSFAKFVTDNKIALPKMANGDPTILADSFIRQASQLLKVKATPDGKAFMLQFGTKDMGGIGVIRKQDGTPFTFSTQDVFMTQVSGQELINVQNRNKELTVTKKATGSTANDTVTNKETIKRGNRRW